MKPKVICHVMTSVDGQIQSSHYFTTVSDASCADHMETMFRDLDETFGTDAWTLGKSLVTQIFPDKIGSFPSLERDAEKDAPVNRCCSYAGDRQSKRLFISIDPKSEIIYTSTFLKGDNIVAVLNAATATPRYLSYLRGMNVSYIVVERTSDLRQVLEMLNREFGIKSISLQGGSVLSSAMLNQGMIDELSLVLYPGLAGDFNAIPLFDKSASMPYIQKRLSLLSVQQKEQGLIWMRYRVYN